jgi:hypothetical protein
VWTLDELVERVRHTLATGYAGAPNHRVRDVPDRRGVRWYTTLGLVDRPAAMRGRTALYGSRHLLQVVAVKRRQAAGRSLAEIQAELAGATDAELAAIASVPEELLQDRDHAPAGPVRTRFWAQSAANASTADAPTTGGAPTSEAAPTSDGAAPLAAVALADGVVLLLPGTPTPEDYPEIAVAAQPLIDLLARRGLLNHSCERST